MTRTPTTDDPALHHAAQTLRNGGIVAYPTEAVYGLGCDPNNDHAIQRLLALKQRDPGKGLILIAADYHQLETYLAELPAEVAQRVLPTWPGPVTWLLPPRAQISRLLLGAHATLAVRVTAHPLAADLCRAFGGAVVSTSANRSNQTPARDAATVRRMFGDGIDDVLDGAVGTLVNPTQIRDGATGEVVRPE
jgi:L-threonylcarbamoyladenylate synthase